jgi:hypothetical protein
MSADENLANHLGTYRGFTRLLGYGSAMVIVVIVILAFVTL